MYAWAGWRNGKYFALKNDNTVSNDDYFKAVTNVIKQQPLVFLKSRIKAFRAVNILHPEGKLYVATFTLLAILLYSIKRKNMVLFVLTLGVLIHSILTTLTMPASYIKYYYEMILFVLFFLVIIINVTLKNKNLTLVKAD